MLANDQGQLQGFLADSFQSRDFGLVLFSRVTSRCETSCKGVTEVAVEIMNPSTLTPPNP